MLCHMRPARIRTLKDFFSITYFIICIMLIIISISFYHLFFYISIMSETMLYVCLIVALTTSFLAHLSHLLMVSHCDRWMSDVRRASSVVRRQQLLQTTSPKLLAGF